jgi:hypothetical protein
MPIGAQKFKIGTMRGQYSLCICWRQDVALQPSIRAWRRGLKLARELPRQAGADPDIFL